MFQKKFVKSILMMYCLLLLGSFLQLEVVYGDEDFDNNLIINQLIEKYPLHSKSEIVIGIEEINERCPQSFDEMIKLWLMDDAMFDHRYVNVLCYSIDDVLRIRSLGVPVPIIVALSVRLSKIMSDSEWLNLKDLTLEQAKKIGGGELLFYYSNLSWDKFREINRDFKYNAYKLYKKFGKKRIDVNHVIDFQNDRVDFEDIEIFKKNFKNATLAEFIEFKKKKIDSSRVEEFKRYFPDDEVSELLAIDQNCDIHLLSLHRRNINIDQLIENKTGCSYLWKGFGKKHRNVEDHGADRYYTCITCSGSPFYNKPTICPQCITKCHKDKGHEVKESNKGPYFCDCGDGDTRLDCCFIEDFLVKNKMDAIYFTQNIQISQYLHLLKKMANKKESFVLATLGIDYLFGALSSIRDKNDLPIINQDNLKVGVYYYNINVVDVASKGIFYTDNISSLNSTIYNQTNFNLGLDESIEEALFTVVRSNEMFETSFPKKNTTRNDFYSTDNDKKPILMMKDANKKNYRYIINDRFVEVELPYVSGGSLVLIMPNPDLNMNILEFDAMEIDSSIKDLLASEIKSRVMSLTVPKFSIQTSQSMGSELKEMFPEKAPLLSRFDNNNILQSARFEISEQGTRGASVSGAWIPKGYSEEVEEIIFNRPFFAIVLDKKQQASFISYVTF